MHGICLLPVIPVRKDPSHRSEMVSQLLFGELFSCLEERPGWYYILSEWDNYSGWVDKKQTESVEEGKFDQLSAAGRLFTEDLFTFIHKGEPEIPVPFGSSFYAMENGKFTINNIVYSLPGKGTAREAGSGQEIVSQAMKFLNSPYLWGGRTAFGLDCSGFTQVVYKSAGIRLPRDSSQQVKSGRPVNLISEALPGDLAFFQDEEGTISHAGIMLSPEQIIHASGKVRIDTIDHNGIYDREQLRYSHKLRTISRIIS